MPSRPALLSGLCRAGLSAATRAGQSSFSTSAIRSVSDPSSRSSPAKPSPRSSSAPSSSPFSPPPGPSPLSASTPSTPSSSSSSSSSSSRQPRNRKSDAASIAIDRTLEKPVLLRLPPESPRYINYPKPLQSEEVVHPPHRGHLPVPRNVFAVKYRPGAKAAEEAQEKTPDKTDVDAWSARATPVAQAVQTGAPPRSDKEAWRRRVAEQRRAALAQGLRGLLARQQVVAAQERGRSQRAFERNRRAALTEHEELADVLTASTASHSALSTAVIRDPARHQRQAAMAQNTAALAQARRESRRDALMELYQAAGRFIVTEDELRSRVDELFRPDYFKEEGYGYGTVNAENIWDVVGKPATVQDMMNGITRTEAKLYDSKRTEVDRTTKRQKQVAEALTGGKMPV